MRNSAVPLQVLVDGKGFYVEIEQTLLGAGVRVLWTEDLYALDRRCYDDLAHTLAALRGVERCEMHRYSADLVIANHVIDTDPFIEGLYAILAEELEPLRALGYTYVTFDERVDAHSGYISSIGLPCS